MPKLWLTMPRGAHLVDCATKEIARAEMRSQLTDIVSLGDGADLDNATMLAYNGTGFDVAVALVILQSLVVCSAFLVFGDPFCPGWLTPALPLVLREALLFESGGSTPVLGATCLLRRYKPQSSLAPGGVPGGECPTAAG